MTDDALFSGAGFLLVSLGALFLYLTSAHQRLLRRPFRPAPFLVLGAAFLFAGTAAWTVAWGGLVGGLLALAVWMLVSVALPYLLARRKL
ncbi:hypothetical protein [Pseudomonas schmalbachii]|uniref:DUF3325 domain-containing protein n=1 Tax=Pseudomonas schmalbachii TaxID=2816993 RepID=A0ABS3TWP2_9PSED|nr:hypothetical protein [Pseudomonas schmalbachii]MBO3278094.1 hypothetical protein [Pseudomonas schmalbachii]